MITPKHTPGPWQSLCRDYELHGFRVFSEIGYIASVGNSDDSKEQTEANARLIAAAPQLLSELEKAVEHLSAELEFCRGGIEDTATSKSTRRTLLKLGNEIEKCLTSALAAIAKATGEAK